MGDYFKKDKDTHRLIRNFVRANIMIVKEYRNSPHKEAVKDDRVTQLINRAQAAEIFSPNATRAKILDYLQKAYKTLHNYRNEE